MEVFRSFPASEMSPMLILPPAAYFHRLRGPLKKYGTTSLMRQRASCGKKRANSPSQKALSAQRRASRCLKDWNLPELIGLTSGPRGGGGFRPILFHRRTDHRKPKHGHARVPRRFPSSKTPPGFSYPKICVLGSHRRILSAYSEMNRLTRILLDQSIEHNAESSGKIKANLLQISVS